MIGRHWWEIPFIIGNFSSINFRLLTLRSTKAKFISWSNSYSSANNIKYMDGTGNNIKKIKISE